MLRAYSIVFDESCPWSTLVHRQHSSNTMSAHCQRVQHRKVCGDLVSICLSWHPRLQNSANGGDNLAGVGGDAYYGKAGGEPENPIVLSQKTDVCQLCLCSHCILLHRAPCQWEQAQHLATETSCMQLSCWLITFCIALPVSCPLSAAQMPGTCRRHR